MKKIVTLFVALAVATLAWAQTDEREAIDARWFKSHYTKAEHMVAMRDGRKLYTAVYTPKNKKSLHPILLNLTTQGCEPYGKKVTTIWQQTALEHYLRAEYIIVFQDVRGYGRSVGESSQDKSAQDAYDTAEWLRRKAKKNNGSIGVWALGEDAAYALAAAGCGHQAVRAAMVQAPIGCDGVPKINTPTLFVGGMFDDRSGGELWNSYRMTAAANPTADCRLIVGPWAYGAWREEGEGTQLGDVVFSADAQSEFYLTEFEFPFFESLLRGGDHAAWNSMVYFSGENCWREMDGWQQGENALSLYLGEGGVLSEDAPAIEESYSSYTTDPKEPVSASMSGDELQADYMVASQQIVDDRADVLTFVSPVLERDVTVQGAIEALLYAEASLPTVDFVVKIMDVAENEGTEMMVRYAWNVNHPMSKDSAHKVSLVMTDVAHTFMAGHRIKVQIHSTWHPLLKSSSAEPCDVTILHDAEHPSKIVIPE